MKRFILRERSIMQNAVAHPEASHQARRRGYCGLASRPEVT